VVGAALAGVALAAPAAAAVAPLAPAAPAAAGGSCSSPLATAFDDRSRVTSAQEVAAAGDLPTYCQVTLLVPRQINVLVVLPRDTWNGRHQAVGNGGYAGTLSGANPVGTAGSPDVFTALRAGYAASATDTGHLGAILNGEWAWSPTGVNHDLIEDFAYRANHEMAVKSKHLIEQYYGQPPAFSYWNGCSTGGREGLTAAMRYPDDFDGVVAIAPAINWTRFIPAEMWPQVAMREAGNLLPSCKAAALTHAVTDACDGLDGLLDRLFDSLRCDFDPQSLVGLQTPCGAFDQRDADLLRQVFDGPRRSDGGFLWYGLEPGTDLGTVPGLTLAATASGPDGTAVEGIPFPITHDWFKWWLYKDPTWDYRSLRFDDFVAAFDQSVAEWADVLSTDDADLSEFAEGGSKLSMWHGLADQLIFPRGTTDYYHRLREVMGAASVDEFARLYMAPNVGHCSGGAGPQPQPQPQGVFEAMVRWRETGQPPRGLVATLPAGTGANDSDRELARPMCKYPSSPRYVGGGSSDADSFRCTSGALARVGPPAAIPDDSRADTAGSTAAVQARALPATWGSLVAGLTGLLLLVTAAAARRGAPRH
jgi:hypothetical protein